MKAGDLVLYKDGSLFDNRVDTWIIIHVTADKKTWHRKIFLYSNGYVIKVPWSDRSCFEVINASR